MSDPTPPDGSDITRSAPRGFPPPTTAPEPQPTFPAPSAAVAPSVRPSAEVTSSSWRPRRVHAILAAVAVVAVGGAVLIWPDGDDTSQQVPSDSSAQTPAGDNEAEAATTIMTAPTTDDLFSPVTDGDAADGSVENAPLNLEALGELIPDADLDGVLQRIGLDEGSAAVAATGPVLNLCAALAIDEPTSVRVEWTRDGSTIVQTPARLLTAPADGHCINNTGEPFASGSYEVSFIDTAGDRSGFALFTVGAAVRSQSLLNDTGRSVCSIELSPLTAGFFQSFEPDSGEPLADRDSIVLDVADVMHEMRAVDCDGSRFETVTVLPSSEPVSLSTGDVVTAPADPRPAFADAELEELDGRIGSLDTAVEPGAADELIAFDVLRDPSARLPVASTDPAVRLCAAWNIPGELQADVVWQFNGDEINRAPTVAVGDGIGSCIPPFGEAFPAGSYQVFLERDGVSSRVQTFTVGRVETQISLLNDTPVEICAVGFSPSLTNFYTYFDVDNSTDFEDVVQPGATFTIPAPFIESDFQALDCAGAVVAESFDIAPTGETVTLVTVQP